MQCYIYSIINNITGERYIGQTTNIYRRKQKHFSQLREKKHTNPKLQNSFNKYGEEDFSFEYLKFDLTKEELNQKEISEIEKYNSYNNGFNLTVGGTGGYTRPRKLNFEQFCFAYAGNSAFGGMTNKTAFFLECDSSTISAIKNNKSYDDYRERYNALSNEDKEIHLKNFIEEFNLSSKKAPKKPKTINDDLVLKILCAVASFSRGTEQAIISCFGLSKGFVHHSIVYKYYKDVQIIFSSLSKEEQIEIGQNFLEEYEIQKYSKFKLKIQYKDLYKKYNVDKSWLRT